MTALLRIPRCGPPEIESRSPRVLVIAMPRRTLTLLLLSGSNLMIVLDVTVVTIALDSIRHGLGFSNVSLGWVINGYLVTFGGFLLLAGRIGDHYDRRVTFMAGIGLFTAASLICGIATSQEILVLARAAQGLGGALASAVAFSLVLTLFPNPDERAKAVGLFGFAASAGGAIGFIAGGLVVAAVGWRVIFLANVPIGAFIMALAAGCLKPEPHRGRGTQLDLGGAFTISGAAVLAVYAIVTAGEHGFRALGALIPAAGAATLFVCFLVVESRVAHPLVPLHLLRSRNVASGNLIGVFLLVGLYGWYVFSSLYLQRVLGYSAFETGLAFMPATVAIGTFSLSIAPRVVSRWGFRPPLAAGLAVTTVGLALFARAPADGTLAFDVMPAMLAIGVGAGLAVSPVMLAAVDGLPSGAAGLGSGLINTSQELGGALGLAVLASVAESRTASLKHSETLSAALAGGYQAAFWVGAGATAVGCAVTFTLRRSEDIQDMARIHSDKTSQKVAP